ncbi:TetR/AcrR family transcriptional regulator C-terminal domain-containing protein [bacterium]|nr:TetR/AcrR family transcriptional regulator C-terminal domain-containing protein [bacterium]
MFIKFFRTHFNLIDFKISENFKNIPESFIKNQISASFIEMLRYWIDDRFKESPEVLTDYYLSMLPAEII